MILDDQLKFSVAQDISGSADVASTNVVDLSEVREIGEGRQLFVTSVITTAFTDGGGGTGTDVYLYGSAANPPATSTQAQKLFSFPASATALVGSGPYFSQIYPGLIATLPAHYQFISMHYKPQGANLTAGNVSSYIVLDIAAFIAYKRGYTIS